MFFVVNKVQKKFDDRFNDIDETVNFNKPNSDDENLNEKGEYIDYEEIK